MEKEAADGNHSVDHTSNFVPSDYFTDHHHQQQQQQQQQHHHHPNQQQPLLRKQQQQLQESSEDNIEMVDYMLSQPPPPPSQQQPSLDRLMSFADVMQFADFGPKLALNQPCSKISSTAMATTADEEEGEEENYFLKFPVLGDSRLPPEEPALTPPPPPPPTWGGGGLAEEEFGGDPPRENASLLVQHQFTQHNFPAGVEKTTAGGGGSGDDEVKMNNNNSSNNNGNNNSTNRRKRSRSMKTNEEVESQRMTHIAVERNRRKQMNEHLRVLRSLMPGTYVQRGDQASIIGGAIEFVRELEQLLQCLESQKRRRLLGGGTEATPTRPNIINPTDNPVAPPFQTLPILPQQAPPPPPFFFPSVPLNVDLEESRGGGGGGLREETAESKSCLADVEVKMLGFDAMIKILSRRKPGQLVKAIEALEEDMQLNILHTNITTIEQTVLYSFNVKITGETRFTAEGIANSVQQIFSFINASPI